MRVLHASKLSEYEEHRCRVRSSSTITLKRRIYSVPSRLIGETVVVRKYEERIEVFYNHEHQLTAPWISGDQAHHINYRHVIRSLVRKPGAFGQYRFREYLFPSDVFRWAWDSLSGHLNESNAQREYLQVLHHAAHTMQCRVEEALGELRREGQVPRLNRVLEICGPVVPEPPKLQALVVNLCEYDELLVAQEVSA